jgi:hypothetical protein
VGAESKSQACRARRFVKITKDTTKTSTIILNVYPVLLNFKAILL